jgi:hypothetical protein
MTRRRILIVEDEFFIAENCASVVEEAGFEVAGPYSKLGDVPQELSGISGAILDLNVCGVSAYPLIDRLLEMNIPVTLYTGYDSHGCPKKYEKVPRVMKPTPCLDASRISCDNCRAELGCVLICGPPARCKRFLKKIGT